jgi:hypothetical protein
MLPQEGNQLVLQLFFMGQFALPDNQNLPAESPQRDLMLAITLPVCFQLRLPKIHTRLRHPVAQAALVPMPEAAVDEDDLPAWPEAQVRAAWQIAAVQPIAISERINQSAHNQLGLGVLAPDAPHALAALYRCECVH